MNELARAHWRKTTSKQVLNTITATDLLNGEITIDAGAMSTNRMIRLTAFGDWVQTSAGATDVPRFKVKLGATTLIDTGVSGYASSSRPRRSGGSSPRFPWPRTGVSPMAH
jgi:hypothetical protein